MNVANTGYRNELMVIVLWGLVISKCFTLEYLVQVYSVPVNSFIYIWALTLTMASVATVIFFRTQATKTKQPETISIIHLVWCGCGVVGILLTGSLFALNVLSVYLIPAILSILLSIGYTAHGIIIRSNSYLYSAIGWWIGAAALATRNNTESLPLFAFLIILLTVLPNFTQLRQRH